MKKLRDTKKVEIGTEWNDGVFIEDLADLYLELQRENQAIRDSNSFLTHEISNIRNIFEREKIFQKACITAEVAKHLFDVSDHMLRIKAAAEKTENLVTVLEGMELISKEFEKMFQSLDVEKMSPIGKRFDPNLHELGGIVSMEGIDDDMVIQVIQDGYLCQQKVIRPAIVLVNKKKKEE
ncbi:nucleotide exchange factor GrpE [bacterium]|nr:nucleotide exchange factor GrpE [bacterium]